MKKFSALFGALAIAATPAQALTIQLINTGGVEVGTQAYTGFTRAAAFWERVLTNNVTVKLSVGFSQLGPNILGSTGSTTNVAYVGQVFPALQAAGSGQLDAIANANLPTTYSSNFIGGQRLNALISAPKANGQGVQQPLVRVIDNNDSGNNAAYSANTSLMKALGLAVTYNATTNPNQVDGNVSFSTAYNWDFNPENGISSNQIDFVGVAIHEIGHALGFRSGVDTFDVNRDSTANLQNFALMSIWDTYRYSAASAALGMNDWAIGGTGTTAPYFSIDGGQTVFSSGSGLGYLSTGRNLGDGRQASHWKDNAPGQPQLGALDPTVAFGQQTIVTSLDLAAYDAMGWNIAYDVIASPNREFSSGVAGSAFAVPEPATWAMMVGGFGLLGGAMRRRRARVAVTYA